MAQVQLRFYEELNDFLPPKRRKTTFTHELTRRTSVKDLIESFGVPHPEVKLILVNGEPVDFSYIVRPGDRISVYPVFESLDVSPPIWRGDAQGRTKVRGRREIGSDQEPLREPRFVIDSNLGQLARYLRLLGFDVIYRNDFTDRQVAQVADRERRIVLTRDRALLQHKIITHGYFVRADKPREQVREILTRLDLYGALRPFTRCLRCNGELETVDKEAVLDRLEPKTRKYYHRFRRCRECGQVYWKGSHFNRMEKLCDYFAARPEPAG